MHGVETDDLISASRSLVPIEAPRALRLRPRHDGFTPARQKTFLEVLGEAGCVRDACRVAGITSTSAYRTRRLIPAFAKQWDDALAMAGTALEAIAFRRATVGAEERVIRDGAVVQIRIKPSDAMLRLLLQGTNPDKYGTMGGGGARLRKNVYRKPPTTAEETNAAIIKQLKVMRRRDMEVNGQIETPLGFLLPPGYAILYYEDVPAGVPVVSANPPRPDLPPFKPSPVPWQD